MNVNHQIIWTALVLSGLLANLRTLIQAMRRRRRVHESGRNGPLRVIASQGVRSEATTLAVQGFFAGLCAAAWYLDQPVLPEVIRLHVIGGWTIASCSVLLTADSILDLADRRRLMKLLTPRPDPSKDI